MKQPFVLGIECSNPSMSTPSDQDQSGASQAPSAVALARRGADGSLELVDQSPLLLPPKSRGSDALMHSIDLVTKRAKIAPADLGRVVVSVGPGGYTSLRVSVTAARALAQTLQCELVGVETYRVMAHTLSEAQRPSLLTLASKKERTHATIAQSDGSVRPIGIIGAQEVATLGVRTIVGDGFLPDSFRAAAAEHRIEILAPQINAWTLLQASAADDPKGIDEVGVLYAREPDAVTQWRARHSTE